MRKKILLFLLMICMAAGSLQAQLGKVPSEVTEAFKVKFPNAQKVEWKDKIGSYEAQFILDGFEMTADFSGKGELEETDKKMSFDQVPAAVKDGFNKSKYNDWTPGSVIQIDKKGKEVRYKIYAEKSSLVQKKYLYFNEKGQLKKTDQTM